jgi:hypothetical protein
MVPMSTEPTAAGPSRLTAALLMDGTLKEWAARLVFAALALTALAALLDWVWT